MNYRIKNTPHSLQRYNTVGDYWQSNPQLIEMRISDFTEAIVPGELRAVTLETVRLAEKYEFLVAIHELVEAFLCRQSYIPFEDIDSFDIAFSGDGEPGDDPEAPYHEQHMKATEVEKFVAVLLGVSWDEYENAVQKLSSKNEVSSEQEKTST